MPKTIILVVPEDELGMIDQLKAHAKTKTKSRAIRFAIRKCWEIYKDVKV